jgi:hypothetical protein
MSATRKIQYWSLLLILPIILTGTLLAQTAKGEKQTTGEQSFDIDQAHQFFAVECNNEVWKLLEKKERSPEETETLINAAHASLYHWQFVGNQVNLQRGYWLLSHVYTVLQLQTGAVYYANRCWDITQKEGLKDFDLAYAYEALARSQALTGNQTGYERYHQMAVDAGENIANQEDKNLFLTDLVAEPWFGMNK